MAEENSNNFEEDLNQDSSSTNEENKEEINSNSSEADANNSDDNNSDSNESDFDDEELVDSEKTPQIIDDPRVKKNLIEDEMKRSYIDYAMSVIVGRALPDVRDGLKPVHRRILFAMNGLGMTHSKPFKKSARIVGEVMGKFHPHGDSAIYDSLVRMAQPFALRYPLIDGQGNFGSIDGDSAAAMRYTEARLSKLSDEFLSEINKDTVDYSPNFSGEFDEPLVLPCKFPNLLVNGSSGIAVGMATNIPPHNMNEICDATINLIDNPELEIAELMNTVSGPDFPTGGIICGTAGIQSAYLYGRGRIKVRAKLDTEERKNKHRIIITEIPYQVNKSHLIAQIADLVSNKVIEGISNIRDLSDKSGIRVVIDLKSDANPAVITNQLFKHSRLQVTFGVINLSLVKGVPKVLNLKQTLQEFINHREEVVRRRTQFDLKKAEERAHVLEGLIIALEDIDAIVQKIKQSDNAEDAKQVLMTDYSLSEIQAKAILDMKLQKLSSLEQEKIREEHKGLMSLIEDLKAILASREKIFALIKNELIVIRDKFGNPRKTEITVGDDSDIIIEDLIKEEDMVVTISHSGYIKRLSVDTYRQQGRGGKGIIAAGTKEEDFIEHLFVASTHSTVLFFSNKGQVYWLKVYEVPETSRQSKGKAIVNLLRLDKDEYISAFEPVREFDDSHYLIFATEKGIVKKTELSAFSRPRKGGIRAITLNSEDTLKEVVLTDGNLNLILATKNGMATRFNEQAVRPMGRNAAGVKGIKLKPGDSVIGMIKAEEEKCILTITENGYGKRTPVGDYRLIGRGGIGVRNIICSERNGCAIAVKSVDEEDELMFISKNGIIIRMSVKGISIIGRNTQGVRLMRIGAGDTVIDAAKIIKEDSDNSEDETNNDDLGNDTKSNADNNSDIDSDRDDSTKESNDASTVTQEPISDSESQVE
ncbi:DNA gyrase subunit A [Candidatus Woesearchaeota archaeon]|jgi:DNA gyrase subunit A|nr:DNA gyrase subunit A [Candidatus Woesearchaeota archaeon]